MGEGRDDFEGFGEFAGFVAGKEEADSEGQRGLLVRLKRRGRDGATNLE